jgi:zinc finger HIT domain-containing protein 1
MSNLIEVLPNTSSHATPGWAYVPAVGFDGPSGGRKASGVRKRAAREAAAGARGDVSSRQKTATLRHLAELDRENHKDVHIPVPTKRKENAPSKGE